MKPNETIPLRALVLALACALAFGCSKREAPESAEHAETHEENIVTLTKQNLDHVDIKTEVVMPGEIETTLAGLCRHHPAQARQSRSRFRIVTQQASLVFAPSITWGTLDQ